MKKLILAAAILLSALYSEAQTAPAFPFQGGKEVMIRYFKDSAQVSQDIIQRRANGTVIFKFTADEQGAIEKLIVYYADDAVLIQPFIDLLRKSTHKWIIPAHEKTHDFLVTFTLKFRAGEPETKVTQRAVYDFYHSKSPILSFNEIPLDEVTLLPTIDILYDLK